MQIPEPLKKLEDAGGFSFSVGGVFNRRCGFLLYIRTPKPS